MINFNDFNNFEIELKKCFDEYLNGMKCFYEKFRFDPKYDRLENIEARLKRISDNIDLIETQIFVSKLKFFDKFIKLVMLDLYLKTNPSITSETYLNLIGKKNECH